jgi:hypothetical protein
VGALARTTVPPPRLRICLQLPYAVCRMPYALCCLAHHRACPRRHADDPKARKALLLDLKPLLLTSSCEGEVSAWDPTIPAGDWVTPYLNFTSYEINGVLQFFLSTISIYDCVQTGSRSVIIIPSNLFIQTGSPSSISIPSSLFDLGTDLTRLQLGNCSLAGPLPLAMTQLNGLSSLDLSSNALMSG